MIVYAYYGFGKTTLCENNKFSPFIEIDEEFGQADDMHVLKQLSKHSILLLNGGEYVNYDERRAARELAKELLDLDLE